MRELLRHWMRQRLVGFLCAFLCVFAGLALAHGPGPVFSKAHAALGNVLVGRNALASGVKLHFEASDAELEAHPWRVTLHIQPAGRVPAVLVPIDVRLRSLREHVKLLAVGLAILEPLLLLLVALPLLSFLGGTGPIRAFSLSRPTHVLLQISYRALVVPPGMAYALPLFLWWSLLMTINRNGTQNSPSRNTNLLDGSA